VRLAHLSDTHGLPRKGIPDDCEIVVHTGDLCPNRTRGVVHVEVPYQTSWLQTTAPQWERWLDGRHMVMVTGNHDFVDVAAVLAENGLSVHSAAKLPVELGGLVFHGHGLVPPITGEWAGETPEGGLIEATARVLEHEPDVLLLHCPLKGYLDAPFVGSFGHGVHIGSSGIRDAIRYSTWKPQVILHGHCHEQGGRQDLFDGIPVHNSATTLRVIDL
jgi:Icc-related predicted phosphoesterase